MNQVCNSYKCINEVQIKQRKIVEIIRHQSLVYIEETLERKNFQFLVSLFPI